jgi:NifU-like protein
VAPRRRGDLEPADATGEAGSLMGGAGVRLTLRLAGGRVTGAGFRVVGGAAPLATGSALADRLVGLSVPEARRLTAPDVLAAFGGPVPERAARSAHLWIEALGRALGAPPDAPIAPPPHDDRGILVCRCLAVGDLTIRRAIRRGARDVPAIGDACAAGTGCHSCWPDLRALLDEETAPPARAVAAGGDPVSRIVDALVGPLWRAQGIALGGASISRDAIRLRVASESPGALASPIGAVAMARHLLREVVGDDVRVELEDGAVVA